MPALGAAGALKGKRVEIPHDLVTVIREFTARVHPHRSLECIFREGGCGRQSFSQETCLLLVQGRCAPDHEELVVPKSPLKNPGLFVLPSRKQKDPLFFSGSLSCTPSVWFHTNTFSTGKEKTP